MNSTLTYTAGHVAHAASARPDTWLVNDVAQAAIPVVSTTAQPSAKPYGMSPGMFPTTAIRRPLEASP